MKELYKRYRPKTLKEIVGQPEAVITLQSLIDNDDIPHTILFCGPSGVGKTTIARILRNLVKCGPTDFQEINCADKRGMETIRRINQEMNLAPISGESRMWLLDEVHRLPENMSQSILLKMLEDTPKHVYFVLATTHPQKLLSTIRTRSTIINLKPLSSKSLEGLITSVLQKEGKLKLSEEVRDKIVDNSQGSARQALVLLNQVLYLSNDKERLAAIISPTTEKKAIDLCRLLISPRCQWGDICKILNELDDNPETIRHIMLAYARKVLIGSNIKMASRAYLIISAFQQPFYESEAAGVAAACWEVATAR